MKVNEVRDTSPTEAQRSIWRRPVAAFAGMVLFVILVVGGGVLLVGGADQPAMDSAATSTVPATNPTVATTVPSEPTSTTEAPQAAPAPSMTWKRVPDQPIFEDATMWTVVAGGPGLVAGGWVGNLWAGGPSQGAVFVSADGAEWERIDDPAFADGITALAVGRDSTLIALGCSIGDVQPILVSQNGRDWDRIYSDLFGPGCRLGAQAVTARGPGFVAVGNTISDDAAVWLSEDGRKWIQVEDDSLIATKEDQWRLRLSDVTEGGPGLVAIGGVGIGQTEEFDAMGVWVSEDGTDWERLPNLDDQWSGHISRDPETGRLFAFGQDMWTSDDGFEWTRHEQQSPESHPPEPTLAWDGERVVAGGPGRNVPPWVSGDHGDSWSQIDRNDPVFDGYRPQIDSLTRFGDSFVAVGEAGDYIPGVAAVWIGTWDD